LTQPRVLVVVAGADQRLTPTVHASPFPVPVDPQANQLALVAGGWR
jgi:hypothetical protein